GTVWRSKDFDYPIEVQGEAVADPSGRRYVPVKGADGVASFVPEDEIVTPGALTPQSLMEARKGLSHFWNQATGPDERGVGALISGLDNHIRDQAASGAFSGS